MNIKDNTLIYKLFEDFNSLKSFNAELTIKKKMLKELLEARPYPWPIIGITPNALKQLDKSGYNKKGIQRAHLVNRDEWYGSLFAKDWNNAEEWYDFIVANDKTVLATSSENRKIKNTEFIPMELENPELFKSTRITWKQGKKEIEVLKELVKSI